MQHLSPSLSDNDSKTQPHKPLTRESWFAYPMIAGCTFRPTPNGSNLQSSIRLQCRDFKFLTLNFSDEKQARDVYDSIKGATCQLGSIGKLYAFNYEPPPLEKKINGWSLYDARAEWGRQGISDKSIDRGWRISHINADYIFSPTYPALLVVPACISDNTLNYAGRYRSRARVPVLTYLNPINNCSITRSSQPFSGLRGNRSIQDEKLVHACFSASWVKDSKENDSKTTIQTGIGYNTNQAKSKLKTQSDSLFGKDSLQENLSFSSSIEITTEGSQSYEDQQHNLIVDARPTVNALAMQAVGLGSENMDHYKFATKVYLGIDNIHVMRDSLGKVVEAIKDSDISRVSLNRERLAKSGWLKHISSLLEGASLIAHQVGIKNSNVLVHCSDGWDRTSQLSALSQLLLEPYYRTIDGFIVLVEKDWLAFGHMFQYRSGFLNSEKWFSIQNDALTGSAIHPGSSGEGRGDAIENALLSAKRFFNKNNHLQEATTESEYELPSSEESVSRKGGKDNFVVNEATKPKETSPIFHQFLDATYQILYQYPTRFEFNERFLRRLFYHLYSCQYGTFLYNNEKSRVDACVQERTASVWDYFLSRRSEFTNKDYVYSFDEKINGKKRIIFPQVSEVRWWSEVFNRSNIDMNGSTIVAVERNMRDRESCTGTERKPNNCPDIAHLDEDVSNGPQISSSGITGPLTGLRDGISVLGIGVGKGFSGVKAPNGKQPMELEMQ